MVDYNTNAHNIYLNASFAATSKLRFISTLVFNKSEAEYDQVLMPSASAITVNSAGDPDLTHQDFTFDEMHEYSDLDYQMVRTLLGAELRVSSGVTLTADGEYAELSDDAGFVYGIESGSLFMIRTGVRLEF